MRSRLEEANQRKAMLAAEVGYAVEFPTLPLRLFLVMLFTLINCRKFIALEPFLVLHNGIVFLSSMESITLMNLTRIIYASLAHYISSRFLCTNWTFLL